MKTQTLLFISLMSVVASTAHAGVTVKFIEPENFVDLPFMPHARASALAEIQKHFEKYGAQMAASQNLAIEVLDIDLAGTEEQNFRHGREVRVLRGTADWPSMRLRYTLETEGRVVKSGESRLSSMNYLHQHNRYFSNEPLRYEKQMIDGWLREALK